MNTRTIVSGAVTLGAPLYIKGEYQGEVGTYFKPLEESNYHLIEIKLPDDNGFKLSIIDGNNIFVPYDAFHVDINDANVELWCSIYSGLIGAGDINDGDETYYRIHGDVKERVNPKSLICYQHKEENLYYDESKKIWICVASGTLKFSFDIYQNDQLKYFIPVAFYKQKHNSANYVDIYRITAYYCNLYSLNSLF